MYGNLQPATFPQKNGLRCGLSLALLWGEKREEIAQYRGLARKPVKQHRIVHGSEKRIATLGTGPLPDDAAVHTSDERVEVHEDSLSTRLNTQLSAEVLAHRRCLGAEKLWSKRSEHAPSSLGMKADKGVERDRVERCGQGWGSGIVIAAPIFCCGHHGVLLLEAPAPDEHDNLQHSVGVK